MVNEMDDVVENKKQSDGGEQRQRLVPLYSSRLEHPQFLIDLASQASQASQPPVGRLAKCNSLTGVATVE
jgi:hypothetical protein